MWVAGMQWGNRGREKIQKIQGTFAVDPDEKKLVRKPASMTTRMRAYSLNHAR
jgi:hypothetical protein